MIASQPSGLEPLTAAQVRCLSTRSRSVQTWSTKACADPARSHDRKPPARWLVACPAPPVCPNTSTRVLACTRSISAAHTRLEVAPKGAEVARPDRICNTRLSVLPRLQSRSGRGAVWIARLTGGQKVAGSNPVAPTRKPRRNNELRRGFFMPVQRFSAGARPVLGLAGRIPAVPPSVLGAVLGSFLASSA